jgi:hypothetical protein
MVKDNGSRWQPVVGLFLTFALLILGSVSCQSTEEAVQEEETAEAPAEGRLVFEGTPKIVVGKYMFMPEAQGFDIVVLGSVQGGDPDSLLDQEIRIEGELMPEMPSVLIADTIDVKEATGEYRNVFTRTEEPVLTEYMDLQLRDSVEALQDISYNQNTGWEGKDIVKVYGSLQEQEDSTRIQVLDEEGGRIGYVLVDGMTDYAKFYMEKLHLFDNLWFYLEMGETVPWSTRRNTRELFHAEVLFAGLF